MKGLEPLPVAPKTIVLPIKLHSISQTIKIFLKLPINFSKNNILCTNYSDNIRDHVIN
jgi:hypothetical protein